jgi:predicted ribosome quality control (RQC) complex YloA/Tae2 family protein
VPRGARTITLSDPYAEVPLAIPLDPRRSPAANAEALFGAARRVERAAERLATRRAELGARTAALAAAVTEIESAAEDGLRSVCERLAGTNLLPAKLLAGEGAGHVKARKGPEPRLPYRRYPLAGGWEIWVGRSAADNDILTHELARPQDLWLHAHGAAGSHVLLRRADGSGAQQPPAAAVQAAASHAAYFSTARHSRLVPVIVTEKRYVRKPRRSPPGTAVCLREKTVMAVPAAPGAADGKAGEAHELGDT